MYELIKTRYLGRKTGRGHDIIINPVPHNSNAVMLYYLFWGEYQGIDDHHHMGIARIRATGTRYAVDLFAGNEPQPYDTKEYSDIDTALAIVDAEVTKK